MGLSLGHTYLSLCKNFADDNRGGKGVILTPLCTATGINVGPHIQHKKQSHVLDSAVTSAIPQGTSHGTSDTFQFPNHSSIFISIAVSIVEPVNSSSGVF